jgi:hypothetical protein
LLTIRDAGAPASILSQICGNDMTQAAAPLNGSRCARACPNWKQHAGSQAHSKVRSTEFDTPRYVEIRKPAPKRVRNSTRGEGQLLTHLGMSAICRAAGISLLLVPRGRACAHAAPPCPKQYVAPPYLRTTRGPVPPCRRGRRPAAAGSDGTLGSRESCSQCKIILRWDSDACGYIAKKEAPVLLAKPS